jgi:hypothetical protein
MSKMMLSSQEEIRRESQERTARVRARMVQLKDEPCEACFRGQP